MKPPFKGNSIDNLYNNISSGKYSPIPYIYSEELGKLISMIIVVDVRKREILMISFIFLLLKRELKDFMKMGKKLF